jgi:hypothetical protein
MSIAGLRPADRHTEHPPFCWAFAHCRGCGAGLEIENITRSEITLRNGILIAVHSTSFRTIRGRTLIAAIFDECGFWRDESATPDIETYRAVMPALATTNGMLIGISTPYRKLGLLHQKHRDHFGQNDPEVLVVQGATRTFNPTLSERTIATQRAADPTAAASEWDAEFRQDLTSFLDDALIEQAVEPGRPLELPPVKDLFSGIDYRAFVDPSGGTGAHSYTICIAHKDGAQFICDLVRGTQGRFDPENRHAGLCGAVRAIPCRRRGRRQLRRRMGQAVLAESRHPLQRQRSAQEPNLSGNGAAVHPRSGQTARPSDAAA